MKIPDPINEKKPGRKEALEILIETIQLNDKIHMGDWIGACFCVIAGCCLDAGVNYDEYCKKMDQVKNQSKSWWDVIDE